MADRLATTYRDRISTIRAGVQRELLKRYEINVDEIDASMAAFVARAAPVIASGQATASSLTAAYIRARALRSRGELLELAPDPTIAGTTREGRPLEEGMAAFGPMVLGQIGAGRTVDEALEYGRFLATRFGDAEVTGAVDREIDAQASRTSVVGWEGIVAPGACDPCQANAGEHGLDEEIYRHGSCNCERVPILG